MYQHRLSGLGRTSAALAAIGIVAAACSVGASPSPLSTQPPPATIVSPSPAAPSSASVGATPATVAKGMFHKVDGAASGSVALEHLADGSFAVVFEDFSTPSKAHINVIVVAAKDVLRDKRDDLSHGRALGHPDDPRSGSSSARGRLSASGPASVGPNPGWRAT